MEIYKGFVYILASRHGGALYIGVTNNLQRRMAEHKTGINIGFTYQYRIQKLVYFEPYTDMGTAIQREKQLKKWKRDWKIALIEKENPDWNDLSDEIGLIVTKVLSGLTCMITEGSDNAVLIDMRTIPLRSVEEPENDKVLRGARDGFGEALQPNAALIRRRIRSPELTFSVVTVGTLTKSDVCICYMRNKADLKFVENVKKQISAIEIESLNFQCQTISEALIKKKWYNPFPRVRFTERPDAAAATLLEGSVIVMCDNSPSAMILPTSIFDFFQETDDFSFPPLTGTYLRMIRFAVYVFSIYLTPVWFFLIRHSDRLPEFLSFLKLSSLFLRESPDSMIPSTIITRSRHSIPSQMLSLLKEPGLPNVPASKSLE